jgi:tripartite-type tricarboxylate transporter receptor subunit TctC
MTVPRRVFLHLAAGAAALPCASQFAWAGAYPARLVRIMVGFPAGGPADIAARLIGHSLSERLSQPFVVENRPGASSNIATETVVRASPDGYTLLLVASTNAVNATLYPNLNFNFIRDVAPIAGIMRAPIILAINASLPATTIAEFTAYAKSNPGKLNYASPGNGTTAHLAGELFKLRADVDIVHVPYRGSAPALNDLLGGQVQAMFDTPVILVGHIRTGKLRALAVGTATRAEALPDVPPMGDFLSGYEASAWFGVGAPKQTPPEILDGLNEAINAALADPQVKARLADMGAEPMSTTPAMFGSFITTETEKWAKVIKFAGIKPE